jgi:hypothetical protein
MTFGQSALLLLLTALLTGLLVPVVKGVVDDRKLKQQKRFDDARLRAQTEFEASLSRQGKILEAQAQLLQDLADVLWAYLSLVIKVSYYGMLGKKEEHQRAFEEYDEQSWNLLVKLLALITQTRRLASVDVQKLSDSLYMQFNTSIDTRIMSLRAADSSRGSIDAWAWKRLQDQLFGPIRWEIDATLTHLARDLRLAPEGQVTGPIEAPTTGESTA